MEPIVILLAKYHLLKQEKHSSKIFSPLIWKQNQNNLHLSLTSQFQIGYGKKPSLELRQYTATEENQSISLGEYTTYKYQKLSVRSKKFN